MKTLLAIDGGGAGARAGLYSPEGALLAEAEAGAANPVAYGVAASVRVLAGLYAELAEAGGRATGAVYIGLSGAANESVRQQVAAGFLESTAARQVMVTDDLRPLLIANAPGRPALLAIAGSGASVMVQDAGGRQRHFGGRGAIVGDEGGAYRIAVTALRAAGHALDRVGPPTALTSALLDVIGVEDFRAVSAWAESADKGAIAALAQTVARVAEAGDPVAQMLIRTQAQFLAQFVKAAYGEIAESCAGNDTPLYIHGGLFDHCERYLASFQEKVNELLPRVIIMRPALEGHRAVRALAEMGNEPREGITHLERSSAAGPVAPPPTERRLEGAPLDLLSPIEIVRRMNQEDSRAVQAVAEQARPLAALLDSVAVALREGGRLVYIGAGTSGRLGVLDAAECPPTFGVAGEHVIAILAGGERALRHSVEGAEDDRKQGQKDILSLAPPLGPRDVLVGVAASGTTPYTLAALDAGARQGATTALICCNPTCAAPVDYLIALDTGPEVVAGSTRLKAGTATKLVLNILSTGAMALSGQIFDGYMVGVRAVNAKLRRRAERVVAVLAQTSKEAAAAAVRQAQGRIPEAVLSLRLGISTEEARRRLDAAGGSLRRALGEDGHR